MVLECTIPARIVSVRVTIRRRARAVLAGELIRGVVTPGDTAAVGFDDGFAIADLVVVVIEAGDRRPVALEIGESRQVAGGIVRERGARPVGQLLDRPPSESVIPTRLRTES